MYFSWDLCTFLANLLIYCAYLSFKTFLIASIATASLLDREDTNPPVLVLSYDGLDFSPLPFVLVDLVLGEVAVESTIFIKRSSWTVSLNDESYYL